MSLKTEKTPPFHSDVINQFSWYEKQGGEELAWRFFRAIDSTIMKLARQPDLGRKRRFRNPALQGLWSCPVASPFQKLLIFYRFSETTLQAWRLMHGARDLPRRLSEASESSH
jgi:plasmid stabilization system protein ParE